MHAIMAEIATKADHTVVQDLEIGRVTIDSTEEDRSAREPELSLLLLRPPLQSPNSNRTSARQPDGDNDDNDIITVASPVFDIPWPFENDASNYSLEQQEQTIRHPPEFSSICSICLEESTDRTEVLTCRHSFCRSCLVAHCENSLRQYPIPCPHQLNGCPTNRITTQQLENLLSKTRFEEYLKHYWLTKGSSQNSPEGYDFFQCPVCYVLLLQGGDTTIRTDFRCGNCHTVSCRLHGRVHHGISCEEFQKTDQARNWEQTEQILSTWTKPCSHCGVSLQKAAGCDHVICLACQQDMCWRCGTHEYLTGKIIRHCGKCNRDYRDHRHDRSYRFRLCLIIPILIPFIVLYMAIAAILCIVTGCFVCCFQCGKCLQPALTDGDGADHARRTKFGWTHGVGATLFLLLLPLIALMEDCGLHIAIVDMLFPELAGEETEIPVLPTRQRPDNGESSV